MPITTCFSDAEVAAGRTACGIKGLDEILDQVRTLTGEDWIAVPFPLLIEGRLWRRHWVERWSLARHVGGVGPWQLHGGCLTRVEAARALMWIADGAHSATWREREAQKS